ncbi:MAG: transporter substrate-binding protein, partial [Chloroflexi bacterium]|nr:transporter substrate-binding protein [Chloroflexota bacterium]
MDNLDGLISATVAGNLPRREFLAKAAAIGVSAVALAEITRALDVHAEVAAAGLNTLTLNAVQVFGNFDPAIGIDYTQEMAQINFYDTLLTATPSAGVTGRLADHFTASADAKNFTFYLKKGVKFHSGHELTAEDVIYSMQRVLAIGQGPSFVWKGFLTQDSVKALDRYTVRFTLSQPFAPFPSTLPLLFIVDKATVISKQKPGKFGTNGDYGQAFLASNEAGSGP